VRPRLGSPPELPRIREQVRQLDSQSIDVEYDLGDDYRVTTLTFTGKLPVLADVEAVFAENGIRTDDQYDISSMISNATADQLRSASTEYPDEITSRYLQVPTTATERTRNLAQSLAAERGNPYDIASNIEQFLRNNLKYREDVNVPPRGRDIVDYFLFDSKEGYCTYCSSAMVEMLRMLGIPSRVAVGFYPAGYDDNAGGYLYRDLNAHAWVEAFFPGYGWIPFEPTAARDPIARYVPPQPEDSNNGDLGLGVGVGGTEDLNPFLDDIPPGFGTGTGTTTVSQGPGRVGWTLRIVLPVLIAFVGVVAFLWLRGLRGLTPATQLFTKVQRGASWGGMPVRQSLTPYEYATRISERIPGSRTHVRFLADIYVRERYGGQSVESQDLNRARHAWLRLRGLLLRYVFLERWRPSKSRLEHADDGA
jgi:transglutaminase-like putative cysteine protease